MVAGDGFVFDHNRGIGVPADHMGPRSAEAHLPTVDEDVQLVHVDSAVRPLGTRARRKLRRLVLLHCVPWGEEVVHVVARGCSLSSG